MECARPGRLFHEIVDIGMDRESEEGVENEKEDIKSSRHNR